MSETSSETYDNIEWTFYRDRAEWKDITKIPQDEAPEPVAAIAYSERFKDVYDYFRAILRANELSERGLELTKDALSLNPANYTVWQYRRLILQHLNKNLLEELSFSKSMIEDHPKNYQVWHHRMVIIQWMKDPGDELDFIAHILVDDPKNYHAWQYRQWILGTFKLFENELKYTDQLLKDDVRNNSAWNQRYFVINHTTDFEESVIQSEITYSLNAIDKATKNESSWSYLRGLLIHTTDGILEPHVVEFCEKMYSSGNRSSHLLAYLVDVAAESAELKPETGESIDLLKRAILICKDLAEEHDKIRHKYWNYLSKTIEEKLNKKAEITQ